MDSETTSARPSHGSRMEREWPRPRDLEVLRWAGEQYAIRLDQVEALMQRSRPTALATLTRLREARLVKTRRFMVGEPMWALPTGSGLKTAQLPGQAWVPSAARLAHLAGVNAVRLHVERRTPEAEWIGERRLRNRVLEAASGVCQEPARWCGDTQRAQGGVSGRGALPERSQDESAPR